MLLRTARPQLSVLVYARGAIHLGRVEQRSLMIWERSFGFVNKPPTAAAGSPVSRLFFLDEDRLRKNAYVSPMP